MRFRTAYDRGESRFTPSGDPLVIDYHLVVKNGVQFLEKTGQHSIQDYIDSFAASTDINAIIRAAAGDPDSPYLNAAQGFYIDTTMLPQSAADLSRFEELARQLYAQLPNKGVSFDDFRQQFFEDGSVFDRVFGVSSSDNGSPDSALSSAPQTAEGQKVGDQ